MTPCRPALFVLLGYLLASAGTAQVQPSQRVSVQDPTGAEVTWYRASYALVIGVSDYTAGWPDLPNVQEELAEVRQQLGAQGFEIVDAPADPTVKELKNAVREFFNVYGHDKRNRLLVFFSGHGYSLKGKEQGYLVPSDAPDPLANSVGFLRKVLHLSRVMAWSRQIEASHVLLVFDSCFSDEVLKTASVSGSPPDVSNVAARPVRQFISAGRAGEQTPEKSAFAPSFARGLRGEADLNGDRQVTGTELGVYLHRALSAARQGQTPQYGRILDPDLDKGEFVFRLPAEKTAHHDRRKPPEPAASEKAPGRSPRRARRPPREKRIGTAEEPVIGPVPIGLTATRLSAVKVLSPKQGVAVRIIGDGQFVHSSFRLENPLRFVIDLSGVVAETETPPLAVTGPLLGQIRVGQFKMRPKPVTRIVFDLHHWSSPTIATRKNGLFVRFPAAPKTAPPERPSDPLR